MEVKNILKLELEHVKEVDRKAISKAKISTQFIGFAEDIPDSSTRKYCRLFGKLSNTGNYSSDDIIFVSIPGKRGGRHKYQHNIDKTIKEVQKALDSGAIIITDNEKYAKESEYNIGEYQLNRYLRKLNICYSEVKIDGWLIGVWNNTPIKKYKVIAVATSPKPNHVNATMFLKNEIYIVWEHDEKSCFVKGKFCNLLGRHEIKEQIILKSECKKYLKHI